MHTSQTQSVLSKQELADAIQIWNHASISLVDIRRRLISPEEPVKAYRLPSSALVYTGGGKAEVALDQTVYSVERFGLFHGGKGTELSIVPADDWLDCYMVLYRAGEPAFHKGEYIKRLERTNPFRQQYGFTPDHPVFFTELLQKMHQRWKGPTPLHLFYGKTAFYQLVYEIYEEIAQRGVCIAQPDLAAMIKRHIDQNYHGAISLQELAGLFGVGPRRMHRLFKEKTGMGPQDYLMQVRLQAARQRLIRSDFTLREIGYASGFCDEYHLSHAFKKHYGISPDHFRRKIASEVSDSYIGNALPFPYNGESRVSFDKLNGEGVPFMFRQMRSKAVVAAALSLLLLMSACGTPAANTSGEESTPTQTAQTQVETESTQEGTRVVSTVMGDVEVPVNPQKIAVWVYEQELYSLGVTPVSVSPGNYETMWPDVTVFSYAPDKEELMSLEPDLLITYDDATFYKQYSDIAPVVCIPLDTSAEEALRFIGDLLNMSEKTEEIIRDFNQQVETAKASMKELGALGKTAVLVEPLADSIWIYDNAYGRGGAILYDYLGFVIPDAVKNELGDNHFIKVSLELLPQYCDADYIVVVTGEGYDALKEKTIWQSISAVKNNQVMEYDVASLGGRGLSTKTLSFFAKYFTEDQES